MELSNITIESERLILSPIAEKYAEDIFSVFTHEVTKYMTPKPAEDISETLGFICGSIEQAKLGKEIVFAILKKEGEFLGCMGVHKLDTETPELGIWLKIAAHGSYYGREAAAAAAKWAFSAFKIRHLAYLVDKRNHPSRKIAVSLGGKEVRQYDTAGLAGNVMHTIEYHIEYEDFLKSNAG